MRRFLRFGLRTCLLGFIASSLFCGYVGKNYVDYENERKVITEIQEQVLGAKGRFKVVAREVDSSRVAYLM